MGLGISPPVQYAGSDSCRRGLYEERIEIENRKMARPRVNRILHTRYRVEDLERTVAFYRDVLGLEEVRRHRSPRGSELVFFKAPGSDELIEICRYEASGPVHVGHDLTHLAFDVEDMEAFGKHSASLGYPFSDGPTVTGTGSVIAFLDAPEGYEVELIQREPTPSKES
jgi:lactoylglutathione lyase